MSAREHYDQHLARYYTWMAGDFKTCQKEQLDLFRQHQIIPQFNKTALDLGSGHGIQSTALALQGFKVTAIDFNRYLLDELEQNKKNLIIKTVQDDILNVRRYANPEPELITCWGDTLTHLETPSAAECFINDCCAVLSKGGKLLLSFRDYTSPLEGNSRFIPVRSDENLILTCFLEYDPLYVNVTDIIHEKNSNGWEQKLSSYKKIRIDPAMVITWLRSAGMDVIYSRSMNRMVTIIAVK